MARVLAKVPRKSTIVAPNGHGLLVEVERRGLDPAETYFKTHLAFRYAYRGSGIPSAFSDKDRVDFGEEFLHLRALHAEAPGNVVMPIAIVRITPTSMPIGYVMERARGRSLNYYRKRIEGARLADPIRPETIRDIETYVSGLEQLVSVLKRFHRAGLGHGDANAENCKIRKGMPLKVFDPTNLITLGENYVRRVNLTGSLADIIADDETCIRVHAEAIASLSPLLRRDG